jgi:hypothetical protein
MKTISAQEYQVGWIFSEWKRGTYSVAAATFVITSPLAGLIVSKVPKFISVRPDTQTRRHADTQTHMGRRDQGEYVARHLETAVFI